MRYYLISYKIYNSTLKSRNLYYTLHFHQWYAHETTHIVNHTPDSIEYIKYIILNIQKIKSYKYFIIFNAICLSKHFFLSACDSSLVLLVEESLSEHSDIVALDSSDVSILDVFWIALSDLASFSKIDLRQWKDESSIIFNQLKKRPCPYRVTTGDWHRARSITSCLIWFCLPSTSFKE